VSRDLRQVDREARRAAVAVAAARAKGQRRKEIGEVPDPEPELPRAHARRVRQVVREGAEHFCREELGDGLGHAGEAGREEGDGALLEEAERRADAVRGICPRVVVVQPEKQRQHAVINAQIRKNRAYTQQDTHMLISTIPSDQTSAARGI
jgi:hypothetical protein